MINNGVNITFDRNMHTTPITIQFRQKRDQYSIIPAKLHRNVYAKMLLINPTTNIINNDGKVFTHPHELPVGNENVQSFTVTTENNTKFNAVKFYIFFKIESTIQRKNRIQQRCR